MTGMSFRNCSPSFSRTHATTWEAFRRFAVDGVPAAKVTEEIGVSVNSVIQAKWLDTGGYERKPANF